MKPQTCRPRTVHNTTNNNRFVVEQHIRVFGNESVEHISTSQIQSLLADPSFFAFEIFSSFFEVFFRGKPRGCIRYLFARFTSNLLALY